MDLDLPVRVLLNQKKDSEVVKLFLLKLEKVYNEVNTNVKLEVEEKVFADATYYNIRPFGLSFCFDIDEKNLDLKDLRATSINFLLKAIHVFQNSEGYAQCPLKLTEDIDLKWRAREVVLHLGEPQKKAGGGNVPISITYMNRSPKIEIDFVSGNWSDPFNKIASVIFFD